VSDDTPVPIVRRFLPIPKEFDKDDEQLDVSTLGLSKAKTWAALNDEYRTVILADAGAGKTHEMRIQAEVLRDQGCRAFFLRIEDMADGPATALEIGTSAEYREWRQATDEAWFFLDSVDEAKLDSPRAFEKAIRRFAAEIHDCTQRAHVILSSRPYAWAVKTDRALVETLLPFSKPRESSASPFEGNGDPSASRARHDVMTPSESWQVYKLGPLNAEDVRTFATARDVHDVDALLAAIARADLWSMAERPFDLNDIFSRWKPGEPLGSRLDILQHGVRRRLLEIDETRIERQPLNVDKALNGARRLAAAVTLTKNAGIRVPDGLHNDIGVDATVVLGEWELGDVKALLGRAVFNDAIYGAVRFRHREMRELLTAEWLADRIRDGERRAVEALIFREQYGEIVISPTMRPILPWLILLDTEIRRRALAMAPEIAAEGGDAARLPVEERRTLLAAIVERIASEDEERATHHNEAIARIAQRDLGDDALALIERYCDHDDAIFFLGRFVWQGELGNCTLALLPIAKDPARSIYARIASVRAVLTVGTSDERTELWSSIVSAPQPLDRRLLAEMVSAELIPTDIAQKLLLAIDRLGPRNEFETAGLKSSLHRLIERLDPSQLLALAQGLNPMLEREPHVERGECAVSEDLLWLLGPALHVAERLVAQRLEMAFDEHVFGLLMKAPVVRQWRSEDLEHKTQLGELVPAWPEFNDRLYWADVARARASEKRKDQRMTDDWPAAWVGPFWRFREADLDRLVGYIINRPLVDDRLVALHRAFWTYRDAGRPRRWRVRLNAAAASDAELRTRLAVLYRPPVTESQRSLSRQMREHERRAREREERQTENRRGFVKRLRDDPDIVRHPPGLTEGQFSSDQYHLMGVIEGDGLRNDRVQGADWRALIPEFGEAVAAAYRDAAVAHWRHFTPSIRSEGGNTGSVPYSLIFAMIGLEIERLETAGFPANLSDAEAAHALRYIGWGLNDLPAWLEPMFRTHREIACDAVWKEMEWELEHSPADTPLHYMLHDVLYHSPWLHAIMAPRLLEWLLAKHPPNDDALRQAVHLLVSGGTPGENLVRLARTRIEAAPAQHLARWFALWVDGEPASGISATETWLASIEGAEQASAAAQLFVSSLQGGRRDNRPKLGKYRTAQNLKSLYVLMHRYIRTQDDIERAGKGVYSPVLRDDAQEARNLLFNQLSEIPGKATYTMLLELAEDHPDDAYRSWMKIRARTRAVADSDLEPWTAEQVREFAVDAERTPKTARQLFDLTCARLLDFKNWVERGNDSPAATYRRVEGETEMRNLVAGWLNQQARDRYTTAQEPEYANAQRSDFWLQNPGVPMPVPIELKLADKGWSGPDLCERLRNQLVGDYLRERRATAGVMLLVWQGREPNRTWQILGERLAFHELADGLRRYWSTIAGDHPEVDAIEVVTVDMTMRGKKAAT